jgi:hypothetical protein
MYNPAIRETGLVVLPGTGLAFCNFGFSTASLGGRTNIPEGAVMISSQENTWKPLEFLVGAWKGQGSGEPGIGEYERDYRFIFNRTFLEVRNRSTYPPSETHPAGEVHEDLGYFSYDKLRQCVVFRQFHVEGFVNQYRLDTISADGTQLVFVSEAIENIAAGWKAKETYQVISENEFMEIFELAPPGQPFGVYTTVTLQRFSR